MFDSIITTDTEHCLICGNPNVVMHHAISGTSGRKLADEDNLTIPLCPKHHNMDSKESVHLNPTIAKWCKMVAQFAYIQNEVSHGLTVEEARKKFFDRYKKFYI
jgi:hypothetical protein